MESNSGRNSSRPDRTRKAHDLLAAANSLARLSSAWTPVGTHPGGGLS
jgi:hypothetical protein